MGCGSLFCCLFSDGCPLKFSFFSLSSYYLTPRFLSQLFLLSSPSVGVTEAAQISKRQGKEKRTHLAGSSFLPLPSFFYQALPSFCNPRYNPMYSVDVFILKILGSYYVEVVFWMLRPSSEQHRDLAFTELASCDRGGQIINSRLNEQVQSHRWQVLWQRTTVEQEKVEALCGCGGRMQWDASGKPP